MNPVVQFPQLTAHQPPKLRIQRSQWFVHQERLRPSHDRATKRDALAIAAGKTADPAVEQLIDLK
jgi:hypothetical protein